MTLIEKHQKAIEILLQIEYFENLIQMTNDSLKGIAGEFANLKIKYEHDGVIYNKCIDRIKQRYDKLFCNEKYYLLQKPCDIYYGAYNPVKIFKTEKEAVNHAVENNIINYSIDEVII